MQNKTRFVLEALQNRWEKDEKEKDKEWRKLKDRISTANTNQEILELRDDVNAFMNSDASDEDKRNLSMYVESLAMLVAGVEILR